jgi:hypothetical protein
MEYKIIIKNRKSEQEDMQLETFFTNNDRNNTRDLCDCF